MSRRDRNGTSLADGDRVMFQYDPKHDSPRILGRVLDARSHRAKQLDAVLFKADGQTTVPQFIGGEHMTLVPEHPCGRCGLDEGAGAAGLCEACNRLADERGEGQEQPRVLQLTHTRPCGPGCADWCETCGAHHTPEQCARKRGEGQ